MTAACLGVLEATHGPSRGTSGRPRSRPRAGSASCSRRASSSAAGPHGAASAPGCPGAAEGRGSSRGEADFRPWRPSLVLADLNSTLPAATRIRSSRCRAERRPQASPSSGVSGPGAAVAAERCATPCPSRATRPGRRSAIPMTGDLLDRGLVLFFPAPASFTGEDVLELQIYWRPRRHHLRPRGAGRPRRLSAWPSRASSPAARSTPAGWT